MSRPGEIVPPIPEVPESDIPSGGGISNSSTGGVKLRRSLRLHNGVAMIVGCIVGSGIFITPAEVLTEVRSPGAALIMWLFCGIVSTIGAYCYCELGTMITESGGDYAYIKNSLGRFMGFLCLWGYVMVICPSGNAVTALTFSKYVLQSFMKNCEDGGFATTVLAIVIMCLLTFINCANVNWANNAQVVFTITKVLALTIIIIVGFVHLGTSNDLGSFSNMWENTPSDPGLFALGFYQGIFSFSGWNALNFLTEEIQNPEKNLPRAVLISMPLVTVIYMLVNCAYFIVLSVPAILSSTAVAITFADDSFKGLHYLIPIFVALSTVGSLNGAVYISSRLFFVGARDSLLPDFLALVNIKRKTPIPALVFQCLVTISYLIVGGRQINKLINFCSFAELAFIAFALLGMIVLKWRKPTLARPVRVHSAFAWILLILLVYLLFAPLMSDSKDKVFIGFIILISGAPFFIVCRLFWRKLRTVKVVLLRLTLFVQKLFICVPETADQPESAASNEMPLQTIKPAVVEQLQEGVVMSSFSHPTDDAQILLQRNVKPSETSSDSQYDDNIVPVR